jgi:hypothetical protein
MFGKKEKPLPPFTLQVLTTEYLIEGTVDGSTRLYFPDPDFQGSIPIPLTSVQVQPTRLVGSPTQTCNQFAAWGSCAVALIPRVEVTQIPQNGVWSISKIPLRGVFYFGPYLVQGTLMRLRADSFESEVPMFDVYIKNQTPGAQWGELRAPFALMNIHWLHGYELK